MANPNNNIDRDEFGDRSNSEADRLAQEAYFNNMSSFIPLDTSDFAREAANDVGGQTVDAFIDGYGQTIPMDDDVNEQSNPQNNSRPPIQPIDINYSGSNQPGNAKARPEMDPNNPNYQSANQTNNPTGYIDADGVLHQGSGQGNNQNNNAQNRNPNAASEADVRNFDSSNQENVDFDYDEFGQATGAHVDPRIIEVSMEERMREQENPADKGVRLNSVMARIEMLETLRASVGIENPDFVHTNSLNTNAYEQVMKINDTILALPDEKIFEEQHRKQALRFLDNLAKELKANPNGTLETSIDSDRVMTREEFNSPAFQEIGLAHNLIAGDKSKHSMDSVAASMFAMQQKADGNYPFIVDAEGHKPLTSKFKLASLRGLSESNVGSAKNMSAYLEVKFARENFDVLSDKYKNGVTIKKLDEQLEKFKEFGVIGHIRGSNRNLDKNPAAANLFTLDGIPVSEPVAFDEISDFISSANTGSGAFSNTSENPQLLKDKALNASNALNYQIANLSFLPDHLMIPESTTHLGAMTQKVNNAFDSKAIEAQNASIKENGINQHIWGIANDLDRVRKLSASDPDNYKLITDALAFTIKNYQQVGNFTDKQDEHAATSNFPSQSELRYALMNMEKIDGKEVLESSVPLLTEINPINAKNGLLFTNKDAQAIYNRLDADLDRDDLTDADVQKNQATEKNLLDMGFAKGSDFTLVDTPNLNNFGSAQGRLLLNSYLNNIGSHRDFTSDGLASSLGAGMGNLPLSPSGGAFGDAVSDIAQALVSTNNGDIHPSKIGMVIDDILSDPTFSQSAKPIGTDPESLNAYANPAPEAPLNTDDNSAENSDNQNPTPNPSLDDTQDANPPAPNSQQAPENETEEQKKVRLEQQERDNKNRNNKGGEKGQGNGNQGYTVTGAGALVHALGRGIIAVSDMLRFPILSGVTQAAIMGSPCSNDPSSSSSARHKKLPDNVSRNLVRMNESAIKFEIASKALEVNSVHKMLSPKDVKTVQKDVKKHFDAYNESALLSSESLLSMAPSLSKDVRMSVANQMKDTQKKMTESVSEATSKGLFSLNPNQKKISEETEKAVSGVITGLKNFFTNNVFMSLGAKPR